MKRAGLYIDFPFCIARCAFCAFPIQGFRAGLAEDYLAALHKELTLIAETPAVRDYEITSLYLGGGTPTTYSAEILSGLVAGCREHFQVASDAEITLEAHPATLNASRLSCLRQGGINRLSMGVQSFSDAQLRTLGRNHTAEEADTAFHAARSAGFTNIGIDLIYGLPEQDADAWTPSLQHALALSPEHLSVYGLSIEKGTLFGRQEKAGTLMRPRDEVLIGDYESARAQLTAAGYFQYEISNFAKPGFPCRHNQRYWDRGEIIALGLAGHSYFQQEWRENTEILQKYIETLKRGMLPSIRCEKVSEADERIDKIIFGLRKTEGIPLQLLMHDILHSQTLARLAKDGLVEIDKDRVRLTSAGMHWADEVAIAFI